MGQEMRDRFGNAAYATIRSFVLKLEELGLLSSQKHGNRVKYKVQAALHRIKESPE